MKKDGIQTRNRKLAAKAKKRRMHDFFKPLHDPRFSAAYGGMGSGLAGCYPTNPMSQYYAAGQMGQMSQFMPSSMAHMSGGMSSAAVMSQDAPGLGQQDHLSLHHQQQSISPTTSSGLLASSSTPSPYPSLSHGSVYSSGSGGHSGTSGGAHHPIGNGDMLPSSSTSMVGASA